MASPPALHVADSHDLIRVQGARANNPIILRSARGAHRYSPKCPEGVFSELRMYGVLGSLPNRCSPKFAPKSIHLADAPSPLSMLNRRIELAQLYAGVFDSEAPIHAGGRPVAFRCPRFHFSPQRLYVCQAAPQALPHQNGEFYLLHVQPRAMHWRVDELYSPR